MIYQTIPITPKGGTAVNPATLTTYVMDSADGAETPTKRSAVLICPGGGYTFSCDREAEPAALAFNSRGYHAFVLRYNVSPSRFPQALLEYGIPTEIQAWVDMAAQWGKDIIDGPRT